jgi:hypothetical protein
MIRAFLLAWALPACILLGVMVSATTRLSEPGQIELLGDSATVTPSTPLPVASPTVPPPTAADNTAVATVRLTSAGACLPIYKLPDSTTRVLECVSSGTQLVVLDGTAAGNMMVQVMDPENGNIGWADEESLQSAP